MALSARASSVSVRPVDSPRMRCAGHQAGHYNVTNFIAVKDGFLPLYPVSLQSL